ncbi:MAG: alpha/beta hydrolase [Pseudomonadota bacterium]
MSARLHGAGRAGVALLDGGPGASGEVTPVAQALAGLGVTVLEPVQTGRVIADVLAALRDDIAQHSTVPVVLMGWSWGAWLACLYAAAHPGDVRKVVLIGCPPFTQSGASQMRQTRSARLSRAQMAEIAVQQHTDRLMQLFDISDAYDPVDIPYPPVSTDWDQHRALWAEASALRRSGAMLERALSLTMPVRALHGVYDPHPAEDVRHSLAALPDFEMTVIDACGHKPWREAQAWPVFHDLLAAQAT